MARNWSDYRTSAWVQWCPGCGNYGILTSLQRALAELDLPPEKTTVVSGIGCSSRIPYYVKTSNVHTLHGRPIPVAQGIKIANPDQTVIVSSGDGDLLGIGAGHFVALGRRNIQITVILHDNAVYGLTKGQASPTLHLWVKTKALDTPNIQSNINPLLLAFASGYTFIARAYAYHIDQLKEMIKKGIRHKGTSLIDVLQPCPTYNNIMTKDWYEKRIYYLEKDDPSWDPTISSPEDFTKKSPKILEKMNEWEDRIPLGIFYINNTIESLETRIEKILPGYRINPPGKRPIEINGKPLVHPFTEFKDRIVET
ncbi:MAG: 2-oxoacid:ferredoxin oxidoreductase subunit beta [Caldisphaeraceae archaeon]|nr:2-oxoacid:ferredoxin oxidoreductase subunit beta [Caldisphaeraceae archaeon]MEB2793142.1 2-oxoacid:ferredoxin oxidoreductase subunit beta [Caldisphaeraceae archaeon]MEB3691470.1 2-oxoacid:ferredoxin oxidoreductase subunit beta [Caldisphaeraceae archaeon]MEB3798676.1 2-oxoacid:ferredoxin oxidoreductase subunit beta [Caldisphaeraceae archaeon]